jgi:hypothetical protein
MKIKIKNVTKEKIKKYFDYLPLIILTFYAFNLVWTVSTTDTAFLWKHILGLILLVLNYFMFYLNHKVGVISLGITLFIGMLSLLSFNSTITTTTFWLGKSGNFQIPIFYGQAIFLLWLLIHFIVSGRFYFGLLTKKYWHELIQELKNK